MLSSMGHAGPYLPRWECLFFRVLLPWMMTQQQVKSPAQGIAGHQVRFIHSANTYTQLAMSQALPRVQQPTKILPLWSSRLSDKKQTQSKVHRMSDGW